MDRLAHLIDAALEARGFLRAIPQTPAALRLANKIDMILDPNSPLFEEPSKVHYVTVVKLPALSLVTFDGSEPPEHYGAEVVYEGAEAEYNYAHK